MMTKEQLRQCYERFKAWQQAPIRYANRSEGEVSCHNCRTMFKVNSCPVCGQRAGVERLGWKSIKDNISLIWGLDSRSLCYTLLLLLRPGYLLRDYISRRTKNRQLA